MKHGVGTGCTISIGFIPKEFDENSRAVITKAELLEFTNQTLTCMDTGLASSIVVILSMALSDFGYAVDPTIITNAIQGVLAIIAFVAAVYSAYSHAQKNSTVA
jgi:cellobiose-specific phosphotransferase system component IIC